MNFKKQYIALALLMATQVQVTFGLSASLQGQVTELRKLAANAKNSAITVKMKTLAQGINRYADDVNKMPSVNEAVKAEIEAVRIDINNLMTRIGLGTPVVQVRPTVNAQQTPVRQPVVTIAAQMVRAARTTVSVTKPAHQSGLMSYGLGVKYGQRCVRPTEVAQVVQPTTQVVRPTVGTPVVPVSIAIPVSQVENVVTVQQQDASTTVEPVVITQKTDASTSAQDVQASSVSAQATVRSQDAAGQTAQVSLIDGGVQASTVSCDATTQAEDVRIEQLQQQLARTTQEHDFDKNRLEAADEEIVRMGNALYRKATAKPRKVSVETQVQATAAVIADAGTQADDVRQDELAALRAQLQAQQEAHSAHVAKLERRLNKLNTELTDTLYTTDREISKLNKSLFAASAKPSKKDAAAQAVAPVANSVAGSTQTQFVLTSTGSQTDLEIRDNVVVTEQPQDQVLEEVVVPVEQPKQVTGPQKSKLAGKMLRSASPVLSVVTEKVAPQVAATDTAKPAKAVSQPLRSASPKPEVSASTADDKGKQPAKSIFSWPFGRKVQKPVAQPAQGGASASASLSKFSKVQDQPAF